MSSDVHKANKEYYGSKGKGIYSDFSTFAQGTALATSNAIEFIRDFSSRKGTIIVCEYGVGKGDFAKTFLDTVKKKDKRLYSRTRYYLYDFSEKMLGAARKNLSSHKAICIFGMFDAMLDSPFLQFDYCRINELLTDLPAELYMRKEDGVYAMLMENGALAGKRLSSPSPFVTRFLERIDEGRVMPFNFAAERFLLELCRKGKPRFRVDVFDYGFHSAEDVFFIDAGEWNRLMVRNYGGQLTFDMNFPQALAALLSDGRKAFVEPQKNYAERVMGCKLSLLEKKGRLDYVRAKKSDGVFEDDGFFHLRAGK